MVKKMNIASYRVLNTLLCLFNANLTMPELISQLEQVGHGPYNNFLVCKYIHTLRACGIDIQKIQNQYCLVNFPMGLKFSPEETELLYDIKTRAEKLAISGTLYTIQKFFDKIHLPFFKSGTGLMSSPNFNVIKNLEQAYRTNSEIIITDMEMNKEGCYVRNIQVHNGEYRFIIASKKGSREISPNNLLSVTVLDKKRKIGFSNNGVTYELRERLAERYQLRENEQILKYKDDGTIVILNEYEDREVLIQRLLRYDSSCKIIGPADFVEQFKEVVNGALTNYNIEPTRISKKMMIAELQKSKEREKKEKHRKYKLTKTKLKHKE